MYFVYKHNYAKCGFGANFVPTCDYKMSRDLPTDGPIFANLVSKDQKMRNTSIN